MSPKLYAIHSVFHTLQGEGVWAGTPAVFVRFAGCNVWSGREQDRTTAAKVGVCGAWCDTEFRLDQGVGRMRGDELVEVITRDALDWGEDIAPIVVCTGGEPALQLDAALVDAFRSVGLKVHVETNGSLELPEVDWITLSPKPPLPVKLARADEVKCILPDVDPEDWKHLAPEGRVFVQPRDDGQGLVVRSQRWDECVDYVKANASWCRLSLQTHKLLGIE